MAHRQNNSLEKYIGRGLDLERSIRSTTLLSKPMNVGRPEKPKATYNPMNYSMTLTQCETMYLRGEGRNHNKNFQPKPSKHNFKIIFFNDRF